MLDAISFQTPCPKCGLKFVPARSNQMFCSRPCAKAATRNTARGSRNVAESQELRRRAKSHNSRAMGLAAWLYTTPPRDRLGLMSTLIKAAREHDTELRNILTDPRLLSASPLRDKRLFFRKSSGSYRTIAQAANAYCRMFWGHGVKGVVGNKCQEPPTGVADDIDGHKPVASTVAAMPIKPDGWDFRVELGRIRKGFRELAVEKPETQKLSKLGGCSRLPVIVPPHIYREETLGVL
jgi:endogenous inhibitor of DNA gyrase (YacG/DUF329 family)